MGSPYLFLARAFGLGAVVLAFLSGCGDEAGDPPVFLEARLVEAPAAPLAARLVVETDVATTLSIVLVDPAGGRAVLPTLDAAATAHERPVVGMGPDRAYDVEVTAIGPGGATTTILAFETPPLPDDFPPLDLVRGDPVRAAAGWTFLPVFRWNPGQDDTWSYLVVVDEAGEVVWYHFVPQAVGFARPLPDGRIRYEHSNDTMVEIDALGDTLRELTAEDLGIDTIHHELFELADGTLFTLSTELREVGGYEDGTVTHDVVGDVLVELTPAGAIGRLWSTFEILDPLRVRPGFDFGFWNARYADVAETTKDWTHGNAIVHDPGDDSLIVSLRHQDWLVKVERTTGALVWRLGEEGDLDLLSGEWPYHMHAPKVLGDGRLLVYDNGNTRDVGEDQAPFTRVVEYQLDEVAGTVEEVWDWRGESPYFAPFVGDADRLPNGNTLVTDGGLVSDPALPLTDPDNVKSARVVEVTGGEVPEVVFELTVSDPADEPTGYTVYRAERMPPGLGGVWP